MAWLRCAVGRDGAAVGGGGRGVGGSWFEVDRREIHQGEVGRGWGWLDEGALVDGDAAKGEFAVGMRAE